MDESVPQAQHTSILAGANKWLLLLLLFLAIFIGIQIFFLLTRKNQVPFLSGITQGQITNYPTLTQAPAPTAPPPANLEFYRTIRNGQQVAAGQIVTSEYKGTLVDLTTTIDSIGFKIDNGEGFVNELSYNKTVSIDKDGLTPKDIKVGDHVIVTETSDVSKSYPNNIVSIKIVTFVDPGTK